MTREELERIKELASTDQGLETPLIQTLEPQLRSVAKYGQKGVMQGRMASRKITPSEKE